MNAFRFPACPVLAVALAAAAHAGPETYKDLDDPFANPPVVLLLASNQGGGTANVATGSAPAAKPAESAKPAFQGFEGGIAPSALTRDLVGKDVVVTGRIGSYDLPTSDRAPHVIKLAETGAEPVEVVYWADLAADLHAKGDPFAGQGISVRGSLGEFRGRLQVRVRDGKSIRIEGLWDGKGKAGAASAPAPKTPAAAGSATQAAPAPTVDVNKVHTVEEALALAPARGVNVIMEGAVSKFEPAPNPRAPQRIFLKGETGAEMQVIFFAGSGMGIPEEFQKVGVKVRVTGERGEYRGTQQFQIGRPDRVEHADPELRAKAAAARGNSVKSVDLVEDPAGGSVTVSGVVVEVVESPEGYYALLKDEYGSLTVAMTSDQATGAKAGASLRVEGVVGYSTLRSGLVVKASKVEAVTQ